MLRFVTRYDIYLCKRCLEEHMCYQYQKTTDGTHYENRGDLYNTVPKKCKFCGYESLALGSYHKDDNDFKEYLSSPEYEAYQKLREEIQRQPEFDPALRAKLIESRRARSAASMAAVRASANIPKCPTCGSTNVKPISTGEKAKGFFLAGIFSSNLGKSYQCRNCGYKW